MPATLGTHEVIVDGPADAASTFIFAHSAGAPMDHPWMTRVAAGLAAEGIRVVRFEFPYMAGRRLTGKRRGPNTAAILKQTWLDVIGEAGPHGQLVIGGKSMGGRIASMVADQAEARGLVCLGYPFHPAGRPETLRTKHLATLRTPTLILQGARDALGHRDEIERYTLSPSIEVRYLTDGDHSFKPRKASGRTESENLDEAVASVVEFIDGLG